MENYILEAFQKLSLLNEDDFDLTADIDKVDELQSFVADDVEEIPEEPVIDVNAESEDELADNYVGKVIIECECCHTRLYKEESEVIIDEETGLANIDEACPVCNNTLGYSVIGKIEKFDDDNIEDEEDEEEIELENDPVDEEPYESLRERFRKRRALGEAKVEDGKVGGPWDDRLAKDDVEEECEDCKETIDEAVSGNLEVYYIFPKLTEDDLDRATEFNLECIKDGKEDTTLSGNLSDIKAFAQDYLDYELVQGYLFDMDDNEIDLEELDESLKEGVENLSLDTDDTHVEVNSDEDGTHVDVSPKDEFEDDIDLGGEEEIVPLSDEEQDAILDNEPEDEEEFVDFELGDEEEPLEDEEEEEEEEEELPEESLKAPKRNLVKENKESSIDIDEFDERKFNDVCESYLRKVYENVNTFKTKSVRDFGNKLVVEGVIRFKNKKQMNSKFVFTEAKETRSGKVVLEGFNETFSKQPKAFKVKGVLRNNNYMTESMSYNYTVRSLNEGKVERTKVSGRVRAIRK